MSTVFSCPACGTALRVDAMGNGQAMAGGWDRGRAFAMGGPPPGAEYSKETPAANMGTLESGFKLPIAQSLLMALVALLLTSLGALRWHWHFTSPLIAAVIAFCLSAWLLTIDSRRLLRTVERIVGRDLDGDGQVGFTVEITDLTEGKKQMSYCHFPARQEQVLSFAAAMINGQMTIYGNHKLSRRVFSVLRDESISRGLCAWVDPGAHTQGFELTRAGNHVFERLLLERGI